MDITDALAPVSDQLDAVELVSPRSFTIGEGSRLGNRDGRVVAEVALAGFPRVWRPSKGMLDVLANVWGTDGRQWVGRSVTLFNDPDVTFGSDKVGGIRISHMSHIDKAVTVHIRGRGRGGRKIPWQVQPLPDAPVPAPEPTEADIAACDDVSVLRGWWQQSGDERRAQIQARVTELQSQPVGDSVPDDGTTADDDPGAPWPMQDALPTEGGDQ